MAYSNPKEAFENIVEGARSGLMSAFPIKGRAHSLHLEDVAVEAKDTKDPMDIASQYKARMAGESWFTPLYGKLVIRDNATNAVVQSKKMRLMDLPTMTSRLSYIHKGQEYQVADQWQLKPGVYARRRQNGELEARFNVTGRSAFDMTFDPESQKFQIEYKKANLPAYPILKAMGVSDEALAHAWGHDILKANQELKRNATTLAQFHRTSTNGQTPATDQEAIDNLKKVMEASKLRPEVTTMTLGKPFEHVTGDAMLLAGKKLLQVQQGHPEDDRDAIIFKTLRATGELLHDQVKNSAKVLTHKIQRQINKGENPKLSKVFSTGMFTAATSALFQSSLANPAKQINPLDMHSSALQTTIMGPGGIKSEMQVTDEAKMINASQFGFIDPLATPEGSSTGVSLRLPLGVKKIGEQPHIPLYNLKTKKTDWVDPVTAFNHKVVLADQVDYKDGVPHALHKDVRMMGVGNKLEVGKLHDADYVMKHPSQIFNLTSAMVPFVGNDSGNRVSMAVRHMEQAISLQGREAPLVQSLSPSGSSFEKVFGHQIAHLSPVEGNVTKVTPKGITVQAADGKDHFVHLYDNYPLNDSKSVLHSEAKVKVGDKVGSGQLIADSNYTRDGHLALGKNLKVAYMSYHGKNFEDSFVVTESAAKKLSSIHLHKHELPIREDTVVGLKKFQIHNPGLFTQDQVKHIQEDGVIKVGAKVRPGDPLVLALQPFNIKDRVGLGALRKSLTNQHSDKSIRWDGSQEGEVVAVHRGPEGIQVHVHTVEPLQVADKLSNRHGGKGVVGYIIPDSEAPHGKDGKPVDILFQPCYDDQTEFLTRRGWVKGPELQDKEEFGTLNPSTFTLEYQEGLTQRVPYQGKMYHLENLHLDLRVTPNHKNFVAKVTPSGQGGPFALEEAQDHYGSPRYFLKADLWLGVQPDLTPVVASGQEEAWEDYNGVVYCTEVPNHVLVVRRNGKIVISGNCGVGGRMNVGQILETMAGKVAQKTGSTYFVKNFDGHSKDRVEELKKELKTHGLSDTEELTDPKTGLSYGQVLTGPQHFIKLVHQVDKKESVRSGMGLPKLPSNERYDSLTFQPASGDGTGGQSFGQLGLYALLAHGATNILRSAMTYKAQGEDPETNEAKRWKSDHALAWLAMQKGQPLPPPKPTFAYHRFTEMLKGAGINMEKKGSSLIISPLTDKHILEMSKGEIATPSAAVHAKIDPAINHYRPIKGGLFDEKITGGHGGTAWSHVRLAEPLPNPVFEEPIKKVLGITGPRFESILQGTARVDPKTGKDSASGITGGAALKAMLEHIQVDADLKKTKEELKNATPSAADALYKKARYLQALQKLGMKPSEAYILHNVPILPPKLRPLSIMEDGKLRYEDVNGLYMQMGQMNEELVKPEMKLLPDSAKAALRQNLYDSIKNIYGTGSLPEGSKQKGLLQTIHGTSPKLGLVQKGLLSPRQDMSMRSVIIPGPDLHLDQVGLPKDNALTLFRPFVIHQLVKQGTARNENHAQDLLSEVHRGKNDPMVWKALEQVVAERPVLLKRDPALHKYSLQSFYATLVGGSSIKLHPLVTGGFNADHDGDTILGQVWLKTPDASRDNGSVPHTGSVATSLSLIDLKDFPRKEETRTINDKGNIHYEVPEGVTVPAWDGTQMRLLPVVDYSIHPNCEEWQVKTRRGRDLTVSSEHSLAVLDPDTLDVVQRVPRDSGGLCIPVLRQLPETGLLTHIPGTPHEDAPSRTRRMLTQVPLDEETGWFLGATTGDGWVTDTTPRDAGTRYGGEVKRNMVTYLAYGAGGAEVAEEWKAIASRLAPGITFQDREMPHTFEGKSSLSFKCAAFSAHLGRWLLPLVGKGAHEKHLPTFFLQAPLAFRRGLFTGLMDTDGTFCWVKAVSKNKPQFQAAYTTVSKRLCEEVMLLALSLGLVPSLTTSEKRGAPVYSIAFSTRTVQEAGWLKPAHRAKAAAVAELQKGEEVDHGRGDILPLPARVREEMLTHCREVGATKRERDARAQQAFAIYTILSQDPPTVTRTTFQNFWERVNPQDASPYLQKWKSLCENETVGWDLIESAEPTGEVKEMYDLTIPDAWTFTMDNGAVVWDSCAGDVNVVSTTDGVQRVAKVDLKDFPRLEDTKRMKGSVEIYDVPQDTMVYGMRDSQMELFRVTEYSIHKNLPVWDVLLSSGEKIQCSSDHSLACLDMHTLRAIKCTPNESVGWAVPTLGLLADHHQTEIHLDSGHVRSATPELGEEIGKFLAYQAEKPETAVVFEQLGLSLSHPEGVKASSPEGEAWTKLLSEDFLRKAVLYPLAFRQALLTRYLQQRLHQDDSTAKCPDQEGLFLLSRSVGLSCIKRGATLVVYEASSLIQAAWFKPQGWRKKARLRGGYFSQVPFPAWVQDECPVKYRKDSPQGWLRRETLQVLLKELEEKGLEPSGYFASWKRMVTAPHLFWERVESASPTGESRDLYDITVESAQNFLLSTGTLVWDTMSVYVPSTHEEIHDALKMLPSRNIFSDTTGAPAFTPSMEAQLGLHRLSKVGDKTAHTFKTHEEVADALARQKIKVNDQVSLAGKMTTPGRVLLASAAPAAFKEKMLHDLSFELNGKGTKGLFHDVGKHSPSLFPTFADEMKQLGYDAATGMIRTPLTKHKVIPIGAHSYSLEDFSTDKVTRDKHMGVAAQDIANLPKNLPAAEHERQVVDAYLAAINKMTKEHNEVAKDPATRKNNLQAMMAAGVKPGAGQYQQMRLLPGIMSDSKGNLIPTPIATSYGEGLDLGAYWIGSYGARSGTVKKVQEVQEPGYMTKLLQNTSMGTLVDQHDCGTRKGILMPVTHSDIADRHLAQDLKMGHLHLHAGALLDKRTLDTVRTADPQAQLLVRSPLECASEKGVCQKCFGLNANGHHHAMGTNIGVLSAHALGERAVQLTLKEFHSGGAVTGRGGGNLGAFQRLEQLTYLPDKTPNSAVLAKVSGKITAIEPTNTGVQVHIDGVPHFVGKDPTGLDLHTELMGTHRDPKYLAWKPPVVGATVVAGQHLSDPNRTLVNPHRLYEATKDISKVKEFLANEMHHLYEAEGVRKRAVEVVVRSMGNITKIEDAKDHPDLLRGQFYPRSAVLKINEDRKKAGQPLIEHRPTLMGVNLLPLAATEDWLAVLNHQKLRSTLMQNAALGAKSDLHGHHPIPGLIYGAEFGKPKGGTSPY